MQDDTHFINTFTKISQQMFPYLLSSWRFSLVHAQEETGQTIHIPIKKTFLCEFQLFGGILLFAGNFIQHNMLQIHLSASSKGSFCCMAATMAEQLLGTRLICLARWIQINPLLLPPTAKKGFISSRVMPLLLADGDFSTDSVISLQKDIGAGYLTGKSAKKTAWERKKDLKNQQK